jgi:hypothetical protein
MWLIFHFSVSLFLDIVSKYYWMSIKCIHFSFVVNLTTLDVVSCCVFSSVVGPIPIENVKN